MPPEPRAGAPEWLGGGSCAFKRYDVDTLLAIDLQTENGRRQLFNLLDEDGSGSIDVVELTDAIHVMVGFDDREMIVRLVNDIDRDSDEAVDWFEFSQFMESMPVKDVQHVQQAVIDHRIDKSMTWKAFSLVLMIMLCAGTVFFTLRGLDAGAEKQSREMSFAGALVCFAGVATIVGSHFVKIFFVRIFRDWWAIYTAARVRSRSVRQREEGGAAPNASIAVPPASRSVSKEAWSEGWEFSQAGSKEAWSEILGASQAGSKEAWSEGAEEFFSYRRSRWSGASFMAWEAVQDGDARTATVVGRDFLVQVQALPPEEEPPAMALGEGGGQLAVRDTHPELRRSRSLPEVADAPQPPLSATFPPSRKRSRRSGLKGFDTSLRYDPSRYMHDRHQAPTPCFASFASRGVFGTWRQDARPVFHLEPVRPLTASGICMTSIASGFERPATSGF